MNKSMFKIPLIADDGSLIQRYQPSDLTTVVRTLNQLRRGSGRLLTVIQHSVIAFHLSDRLYEDMFINIFALVHDLGEIATGDLSSPVKTLLDDKAKNTLKDIEHQVIFELSGFDVSSVSDLDHQKMKRVDLLALYFEVHYLFGECDCLAFLQTKYQFTEFELDCVKQLKVNTESAAYQWLHSYGKLQNQLLKELGGIDEPAIQWV